MFDLLTTAELRTLNDKLLSGLLALDPNQVHNYPMAMELAPIQDEVSFAYYSRVL